MAFPTSTKIWDETMDPYDIVDFKVDLSAILESSEIVTSFTVATLAESDLYGLEIGTGSYIPTLTGTSLTIWLRVNAAYQANAVYTVGLTLPIELTFNTNSIPPRRKQRTVAVKVIQR